MDKFEEAFKKISKVNLATHIELWGEPKTEKLYFEAGQQSRQTELDQLKNLLEKDEYAHNLYYENANLQTLVEEKDKRIETLITTWRNQAKELCNVDDKHVREALLSCADELEVMRANNANS
ncbi:MAG: hypothetical protein L0G09_14045 [Acinetobacter sp.]|nr:hypothetical protein [Acinetobacter sp.]MDN5433467.1 hypothetical protein [Acinetobacter sp.]MDN5622727.1 hypothetical protein [Acinetobacter sp.]MDN5650918.1 hypothetical protein [Acinetobacter sp.]MDN5690925.1 hypothetical protein [Acinetobacter sp.]